MPFVLGTAATIQDVGVDFAGLTTDLATKLGAVVTLIVGVYCGFLLVKFGMKWLRKAA